MAVAKINPALIQQGGGGDPLLGMLGTIAGTALGTAVGGPLGGQIGASLGGQLAGKGSINVKDTLASAAGSALMGKATEGLTGMMTGGAEKALTSDPLAPMAEAPKQLTTSSFAADAVNPSMPAPAMQASVAGMSNVIPQSNLANPLAGPLTVQQLANTNGPQFNGFKNNPLFKGVLGI